MIHYSPLQLYLSASAVGIVSGMCIHHGVFIHGEWHAYAPGLLAGHTIPLLALGVGSILSRGSNLGTLMTSVLIAMVTYLLSLFTSIIVYRVFFHQLTRMGFDGPLYMRISKLCHVWKCRTSQNHIFLNVLNERYGDFVRTGQCS